MFKNRKNVKKPKKYYKPKKSLKTEKKFKNRKKVKKIKKSLKPKKRFQPKKNSKKGIFLYACGYSIKEIIVIHYFISFLVSVPLFLNVYKVLHVSM